MLKLSDISRIYFLGIGGIGMSALARYFNQKGIKVSGYDKTPTELTRQLESEGISIHFEDDIALADKQADLVVYTPAVPASHQELNYFKEHNYILVKRSEVLGLVTENDFSICVAGTHGKTTTSTMIAFILKQSGLGCNAFLGGISTNYNTNYWGCDCDISVCEADEFDRSFLKLSPNIAVITAMDPDHLDIYGSEENMQDAFFEFSRRLKQGGTLILNHAIKRRSDFSADNLIDYSVDDTTADAYLENVQIIDGAYHFDVVIKGETFSDFVLNMGGRHNVENALAAIVACRIAGMLPEKIKEAIAQFKGVKRRFEYIAKNDQFHLIDDYAHHPEELRALIHGVKELNPNEKITVVFQPHLYSRTKDFAAEFAEVLDMADEVILLPIYPARELPMPGVSSELILENMRSASKRVLTKEALLEAVKNLEHKVLVLSGAGDIDALIPTIHQNLKEVNGY